MVLAPLMTFFLTAALLLVTMIWAPFPMIMAQRLFGTDTAYIQILITSLYGAYITHLMNKPRKRIKTRRAIWIIFTVIFFGQFVLGLLGFDDFLQTGKLHYPIPAMMISGPIYRGSGFVMVGLFLTTIFLTGPSWCSHLCYLGGVDNWLAKGRKNKKFHPSSLLKNFRYVSLAFAILIPLILSISMAHPHIIHSIMIGLIVLSLGMFYLSWRTKASCHCSFFCPISLVVNFLGKINPMRLLIKSSCDHCQACVNVCKYSAITERSGLLRINSRCTLCMDCTTVCSNDSIQLSAFGGKEMSYTIFYVITISLHCLFITVARI